MPEAKSKQASGFQSTRFWSVHGMTGILRYLGICFGSIYSGLNRFGGGHEADPKLTASDLMIRRVSSI
jgi:hypothetical protein